jgi:capsule polysaccharide export protein KpsE/RkpR
MSLIDRVAAGLDTLGKKTQQVFDESKLRMDLARVRRRKDNAARDLGYLAYRTSKGEILPEGESDVLIRRIAAAEEEIGKIEAEIAKVKGADSR